MQKLYQDYQDYLDQCWDSNNEPLSYYEWFNQWLRTTDKKAILEMSVQCDSSVRVHIILQKVALKLKANVYYQPYKGFNFSEYFEIYTEDYKLRVFFGTGGVYESMLSDVVCTQFEAMKLTAS